MLCKHGKVAEASNFLSSRVQEGFLPDIIHYLLMDLSRFKKWTMLCRYFETLMLVGIALTTAYNIIINGLSKVGRVLEAYGVLNEMHEKGLIPSFVTYNTLIDGLCRNGDIDQAMLCFSTMVGRGRDPDVIIYTTMKFLSFGLK
ncbi:hypothetical protein Vadar_030222 [Vaccinium darrowii]|uniref:Uncharacterized protein n=1 Tax=Vaccinium darrowii TaxID=229202 RepID=A0ACB7XDR8_9ERIC|nr:hypothetical protein Vadar_030222 [Vaccinium darrowii]